MALFASASRANPDSISDQAIVLLRANVQIEDVRRMHRTDPTTSEDHDVVFGIVLTAGIGDGTKIDVQREGRGRTDSDLAWRLLSGMRGASIRESMSIAFIVG